jgi:hypothetical protein
MFQHGNIQNLFSHVHIMCFKRGIFDLTCIHVVNLLPLYGIIPSTLGAKSELILVAFFAYEFLLS